LVSSIKAGEIPAELPNRDKVMIEYSIRLTRNPSSISASDIAALRDQGFGDRAILEINLAAAYMNFVNRIALGMGVETEGKIEEFTR
jgi:alkylhydroperoxidase family enzyme